MSWVPKPPFLLVTVDDVELFKSLDALAGSVEGIDVEDEGMRAFDSTGCEIRLVPSGVVRRSFTVDVGVVTADLPERPVDRSIDLKRALQSHLDGMDPGRNEAALQAATLAQLIDRLRSGA